MEGLRPIHTRELYSVEMQNDFDLGAKHAQSIAHDRSTKNDSVSGWAFQTSAWEPCRDMDTANALRTADANIVGRSGVLYAKKESRETNIINIEQNTGGGNTHALNAFNVNSGAKLAGR